MPSTLPDSALLSATRLWIEEVVIGLGLCPFAAAEFADGGARLCVERAAQPSAQLHRFMDEALALLDGGHRTTVLILPHGVARFGDFLDLVDWAEQLLVAQGLDGSLQLAHFHPDYRFAGEPAEDPAHYTNRSPWPLVHLLLVDQVGAAIAGHGEPALIPERNRRRARQRGAAWFETRLARCYQRAEL